MHKLCLHINDFHFTYGPDLGVTESMIDQLRLIYFAIRIAFQDIFIGLEAVFCGINTDFLRVDVAGDGVDFFNISYSDRGTGFAFDFDFSPTGQIGAEVASRLPAGNKSFAYQRITLHNFAGRHGFQDYPPAGRHCQCC